jgi:hypothetical protein
MTERLNGPAIPAWDLLQVPVVSRAFFRSEDPALTRASFSDFPFFRER